MNARIVLCMLLCITTTALTAQEKFKVLAVRGTVSTGSGALKIGSKLAVKDKITLGNGAYLSLAHTNGRTVEVRKAGTFKVADLDKEASRKGASASSKFASYVASELTEVQEPDAFRDVHRSKMRTTGAVERADGDDVSVVDTIAQAVGGLGEARQLAMTAYGSISNGDALTVIMPRHTRLLSSDAVFSWHPSPKAKEYRVLITDRNGATVVDRTTSDTTIAIDLQPLAEGQLHYWRVETVGSNVRSDDFGLYRLMADDRMSASKFLGDIRADFDTEDDAICQLVMATAYEDQGLNYDAYNAYRKAVNTAPGIQNYKRLFAEFLRRNGSNIDAYAVYK